MQLSETNNTDFRLKRRNSKKKKTFTDIERKITNNRNVCVTNVAKKCEQKRKTDTQRERSFASTGDVIFFILILMLLWFVSINSFSPHFDSLT